MTGAAGAPPERGVCESTAGRELAALAPALRESIARHLAFAVQELEQEPQAAVDHLLAYPATPETIAPEQIGWLDLTRAVEHDETQGVALWRRVRHDASEQIATGAHGAQTVAGAGPYERALYFATRDALADGLQPRNGLDWLLVDQMTQALTMQQRWASEHSAMLNNEARQIERQIEQLGGWQAPRLAQAQAVERAAIMADRFQRAFLRLLKTYRDQRRLIGAVIVADGGQLNVAEQQIVTGSPQESSRE